MSPYSAPGIIQTPITILEAVSEVSKFSINDLKSRNRKRELVKARQVGMYLIRKKVMLSQTKTGEIFNRDHSTVAFAEYTINECMRFDPYLTRLFNRVKESIEVVGGYTTEDNQANKYLK